MSWKVKRNIRTQFHFNTFEIKRLTVCHTDSDDDEDNIEVKENKSVEATETNKGNKRRAEKKRKAAAVYWNFFIVNFC